MDRLAEYKRGAVEYSSIGDEEDIESGGVQMITNEANYMKEFFGDVEIVKQNLGLIKNVTKQIAELNQKAIVATTDDLEKEISDELNPIITNTNKKAQIANEILKALRDNTARMKNDSPKQSEIRIRENLVNTLTRRFVDVMKDYQNSQQKYKTDMKKKVKRQVQIVKPDATSEDIDTVMRSGGAGNIFKEAILKGAAADSIQNVYNNVVDKYKDVLTLEASVAELNQMFLDFALLTEQQGEMLDQIEFQVKCATDYVDEGNKNMQEAVDLQISLRKKQCCCAIITLVILGVIALVIYLQVCPNDSC